ncbi:MAG: hypothetical protein JSU74_00565 [Candidatus Zixiibacteriota bacterium]|nr:MAG: hypothetical protein JSU74_00565 [candidate division Zixibacteria bacterium]
MLTHIANPYLWVIIVTVETITYPGYAVCLWLAGSIHDLDWFIIILLNIVIYYLAALIIVFVIDRLVSVVKT